MFNLTRFFSSKTQKGAATVFHRCFQEDQIHQFTFRKCFPTLKISMIISDNFPDFCRRQFSTSQRRKCRAQNEVGLYSCRRVSGGLSFSECSRIASRLALPGSGWEIFRAGSRRSASSCMTYVTLNLHQGLPLEVACWAPKKN